LAADAADAEPGTSFAAAFTSTFGAAALAGVAGVVVELLLRILGPAGAGMVAGREGRRGRGKRKRKLWKGKRNRLSDERREKALARSLLSLFLLPLGLPLRLTLRFALVGFNIYSS